jgi:methanogenic corrinoid protein MtbC1
MKELLDRLSLCIEKGKVDQNAAYPPDLKGQPGASELTAQLLQNGISPNEILEKALMPGMKRIGDKFGKGLAFIPDLLIAAKAMKASMALLKPYFDSGVAQRKGIFILGTVRGDLHDIGKNLVGMVLEGNGWQIVDLGVNVSADAFLKAVQEHPGAHVGLSALLTTTMLYMEEIVKTIKAVHSKTPIFIGGAPVTQDFNQKIGADGYFPDPQKLVNFLETQRA